MIGLKHELNKFYQWAKLTPEEYFAGKKTDVSSRAEWEEDYPDWSDLEKAFINNIMDKNNSNFSATENINLLIQAIAIDHENEGMAEFAINNLGEKEMTMVLEASIQSKYANAQWLLVARIPFSAVKNKVGFLKKFIAFGANEYVKNRAREALKEC